MNLVMLQWQLSAIYFDLSRLLTSRAVHLVRVRRKKAVKLLGVRQLNLGEPA
jgi:hypothetical protein